jgi:hypothetical protein
MFGPAKLYSSVKREKDFMRKWNNFGEWSTARIVTA